jgi:hypothetical protein
MQNKTPRNEKGQRHGTWEVYHNNLFNNDGLCSFIESYINGKAVGYSKYIYDSSNSKYIYDSTNSNEIQTINEKYRAR